VFEAARAAISSNKLMLAGTGEQSTRATIAQTKSAADAGADAALVLNPSYYRGLMTRPALVSHYHAVADTSPIPVIIYNMPACSGLDLAAEVIVELSSHPNIIGIKDSGGDITKMGEIVRAAEPDFQVLAGSAGFMLPALSVGAVGAIVALANIAPEPCLALYRAFLDGDPDRAREIQFRIIPLNRAVTSGGGVPALKTAMDSLGLYGGPARQPIQPLGPSEKALLVALLEEHGISI
jgi:4-hydroxy-2-oxoglutarate aldolase